ncbi:hypothetical protein G4Y73_03430 [Wenzhouxiangella sp. XN201]|uniref:hypothetical protein n=1 Tax=Wenzhouxiangella sp. XN201 TaxID=2710755 RepID=UPI0013C9890D|nr:hypothetical protein [Wenzhouxiangella sp. XN201]NEZ03200.1 hypothetical protein [Wenzhouxiangella sp. XN201]
MTASFRSLARVLLLSAMLAVTSAVHSQDEAPSWRTDFGIETRLHYRDSDRNRFAVNFPFTPDMLPPGQTQGFMETVEPGGHFEVSLISLIANIARGNRFLAHARVDFIDRHDRNPTSGDRKIDVDQLWLRWGREIAPALPAEGFGGYVKLGKFEKFERQNDRHLESYGLVSTAFNRLEDLGAEFGLDLGGNFYLKGSITQGNPLFIRDPNALAGDNGIDALRQPNPDPELKTGIPILYDAEIEGLDFDGNPELGAAAGYRWADASGQRAFDIMLFGYHGKLEETVSLHGTFYGGDLDLLRGPANQFAYPALSGNDREEYGVNLRAYLGDLSLFGQYVDQEIASLPRSGLELEAAWSFELPLVWSIEGRQLFSHIQPAVRYSRLDNDFANPDITPFPSGAWDWEKVDVGVRLTILPGLDLTAEYADNRLFTAGGKASNDEWLVTLRWRS